MLQLGSEQMSKCTAVTTSIDGPTGSQAGLKARVSSPSKCLSVHRKSKCHKTLNKNHFISQNIKGKI